jgi:hypothetical protein
MQFDLTKCSQYQTQKIEQCPKHVHKLHNATGVLTNYGIASLSHNQVSYMMAQKYT